MQAHMLPLHTHSTCGVASKDQNMFFSEGSHVEYQIKGNGWSAPCKHIFCPYTHPPPLRWSQKVKTVFFLKVFMLHIKIKGMELRASCKHIFFLTHMLHSQVGVQRSTLFILNMVMLHIKLNAKMFRPIKKQNFDLSNTPDLRVGLKGQILKFY